MDRVVADLQEAREKRLLIDTYLETVDAAGGLMDEVGCHRALLIPERIDSLLDDGFSVAASLSSAPEWLHPCHVRVAPLKASNIREQVVACYTDREVIAQSTLRLLEGGDVFADCTLVVENGAKPTTEKISAHKFMLAARSPYFAAKFTSGCEDAGHAAIRLPKEVFGSHALLESILHAVYLGVLPTTLASVPELLNAFRCANFLSMDSIEQRVVATLRQVMHGLKCHCTACRPYLPTLLVFAEQMGQLELREEVIQVLAKAPLQWWGTLAFASVPSLSREAVFHWFQQRAEQDGAALLQGILLLEDVLKRTRSLATPAYHQLVEEVEALLDRVTAQLVPQLPSVLKTIGRPPALDVPMRFHCLHRHVVPRITEKTVVDIAFALFEARQAVKDASTDEPTTTSPTRLEEVAHLAELDSLFEEALTYLTKHCMNIALVPPPKVCSTMGPWKDFVNMATTRCCDVMGTDLASSLQVATARVPTKQRLSVTSSRRRRSTAQPSSVVLRRVSTARRERTHRPSKMEAGGATTCTTTTRANNTPPIQPKPAPPPPPTRSRAEPSGCSSIRSAPSGTNGHLLTNNDRRHSSTGSRAAAAAPNGTSRLSSSRRPFRTTVTDRNPNMAGSPSPSPSSTRCILPASCPPRPSSHVAADALRSQRGTPNTTARGGARFFSHTRSSTAAVAHSLRRPQSAGSPILFSARGSDPPLPSPSSVVERAQPTKAVLGTTLPLGEMTLEMGSASRGSIRAKSGNEPAPFPLRIHPLPEALVAGSLIPMVAPAGKLLLPKLRSASLPSPFSNSRLPIPSSFLPQHPLVDKSSKS